MRRWGSTKAGAAAPTNWRHSWRHCRTSTIRKSNELHFDGRARSEWLAGHGPRERPGKGVNEIGDEGFDAGHQVLPGVEAGAPQPLAHEDGEPDLVLVQP